MDCLRLAARAVAFVGLGLFFALGAAGPARAHIDRNWRATACSSESCTVRFIVQPAASTNPTANPPFIGGSAQWRITTNFTGVAPCGLNVNVSGVVTGANAKTVSGVPGNGGWTVFYTGSKSGKDHVKITVTVSGCTGSSYIVKTNGGDTPFEADVGWGLNLRDNGTCDAPWGKTFISPALRAFFRKQCVEDPIEEGLGNHQATVTDLRLQAPGVPFDLTRVYNSLDGTTLSEYGHAWREPYSSFLSINTGVTPNTATAILGTGQRLLYTKTTAGTWLSDSGTTATLTFASNLYTLTLSDQTRWIFNSSGTLTKIIDKNGVGLTIAGSLGTPSTVTTSNGKVITFTWGSSTGCSFGVVKKVALPDGRNVTYTYGTGCQLTSVIDARGGTTSYTYDSYGRLLTITDARGNLAVTNTYDAYDHVATQKDALGATTAYSWSAGPYVAYDYYTSDTGFGAGAPAWAAAARSTVIDARGNRWIDAYTWDGLLTGQQDPLGNRTSTTFDANGIPTGETDPLGNATQYTYDAQQNVTSLTHAGITTSATYDAKNNPLTQTNGRSLTTTYTYDANGNVLTATAPDSTSTSSTYNSSGQILTSTDERGKTTTYTYDANGYLASKTTATGAKTTYGYDASGRLTSVVDPRGNAAGANPADYTITYGYNAADLVTSVTDQLGHTTSFTYDANGNLASRTDANNHTWTYTYDADNRLVTVTAPDSSTTTYGYDAVGNLTSMTDAKGHTTVYTYDAANRLIGKTDPLNRHWVYGYDAASDLTSVTTPSAGTITYGYDAFGRVTSIGYSDGTPSVTFAYDANGNRTSMTDGTGTAWSYTYDQRDRLTGVTHGTDSFAYTYDAAGDITSRTYPDTTTTSYGYDNDRRLTSATTGTNTTTYQYDPAAQLLQTTLPNGVIETATYDRAGRVSQRNDGFRTFTYAYDPADNVTSRTIGTATTTYGYDTLDRLTTISPASGSITYAYDAVGNRTSMTDASGTTTYTYDNADELTGTTGPGGSTSFSYDSDGNETAAGGWTYSFNLANQLAGATNGASSVTYGYDGDGNRVSTAVGPATSGLVWDPTFGLPQLALERDSAGALIRRYTYGMGRISMTNASTTGYYSTDAIGTVTDISGPAGSNLGAYDTNPFGDGLVGSGVSPSVQDNPFAYAGEYRDPVTGFSNLRARQYDPDRARFLSLDPLAPQSYASSYSYVAANPLSYVDPSGLKRCPSTLRWTCRIFGPVARAGKDVSSNQKVQQGVQTGLGCMAGGEAGSLYGTWVGLSVGPVGAAAGYFVGGAVGCAAGAFVALKSGQIPNYLPPMP
jgi:RHS repeat-associated protein